MDNWSGQQVKGYELKERIGSGGFGAVYKAHQSTVGREVAMKIILPHFASHPDFIRRFESEAQIIARLEHLHITPLYDYWRDRDGAYLVMRWLRGGSLRDVLQNGPCSLTSAVHMVDQIASALSTAHTNGVIHRDLKPENILLDEDGNAYLADFGIAKDLHLNLVNTEVDAIIGSPDYLSPEQARSEPVTPQTDVYSFGVVLYEMLRGQHPFPNLSAVERLYKHLNEPLPLIDQFEPQIRDSINAVIQKATAKNPALRYADALAFSEAFRQATALNLESLGSRVIEVLTQREHEILAFIIEGRSNKEIAEKLYVTVATVKWYITQIYRKLGVRSRVQAIVRARELNLIVPGKNLSASPSLSSVTVVPTNQFQPINPYKGLRAFQAADAHDFFGREALVEKLVKRLGETSDMSRFLAIIGPSGSGKSSLVKAGLIPAIWLGVLPGSEKWFVVEMLPGARPLDELEVALTRVAANQAGSFHEQLSRDQFGLLRAAGLILPDDGSELVLIIDQFEEVFTLLEDEAARVHFLNLLHTAITEPRTRVRVIITLRADFYDRPLQYPEFGELIRSRMETVLPLSAKGLERTIVAPAEQIGVHFEEGLVTSIVAEMNYQTGALPLLQYALTELFEQREGRLLTQTAYQQIGGAVGALAKRVDHIYKELSLEGQELAQQMFLRLVTLGEGVEDTRRRAPRRELLDLSVNSDLADEIIDTFAEYRLLSLDHDPNTRAPTVEVAHEAILREWERLRSWLNASREDIRLQRQLATQAVEWLAAGQESSFLLRGTRLDTFKKWANESRLTFTAAERNFLNASVAEQSRQAGAEAERRSREIHLERRSQKFLRGLVGVLLLATIGAFSLTGVAVNATQRAEAQSRISQARELVGYANTNLDVDAELSTLLAIRAVDTTYAVDGTVLPEAATTLHQAIPQLISPVRLSFHEEGKIFAGQYLFSPDGARIATNFASNDHITGNETKISDVKTGKVLYTMPGLLLSLTWPSSNQLITDDQLQDVQQLTQWDVSSWQSPKQLSNIAIPVPSRTNGNNTMEWFDVTLDFQLLLLMDRAKAITVWDLKTGQPQHTFPSDNNFNVFPWFSPDGSRLMMRNLDGTMSVFSTTDWKELFRLSSPNGLAANDGTSAYFTHDGQNILVVSQNRILTIWDAVTGDLLQTITPPDTSGVYNYTLSPDKTRAATSGKDGNITLWDTASGEALLTFVASPNLGVLDFTPDGQHLAAEVNEDILIWNIQDIAIGREYLTLFNGDSVESRKGKSISYSPNTHHLVVANNNDTPIVWDAETGEKVFVLAGHTGAVFGADWSPDGKWIITTSEDRTAKLWDAATGQEIRTLSGHNAAVYAAAFSPDSQLIATSSDDGTVRVWNVVSGELILTLDFNSNHVRSVAWSPDGKRIAASSTTNGMATIWDAMTGEKQLEVSFSSDDQIYAVAFSPDGTRIVTSSFSQKSAFVWDAQTGEKLMRLSGHTDEVGEVAYSPDGTEIATASLDGTVRLWDARTGQEILTLAGAPQGVGRVAFSPDGTHLASQNFDSTTRIYVLPIDDVIALAKSRLTRTLTPEECQRYLHADTCIS